MHPLLSNPRALLRFTVSAVILGLLMTVGIDDLLAQAFENPFIKGENVGVVDEQGQFENMGTNAQNKLNRTLSCSLFSVWIWIGKPLLIVAIFATFFYNMFRAIKEGSGEAASKMLWAMLAMMLFIPTGGAGKQMYDNTIVDKMVQAGGLSECAVIGGDGLRNIIESGNPTEPGSTGNPAPLLPPAPTVPTSPTGPITVPPMTPPPAPPPGSTP